jgi:site-specific DNA-cytosine methylase
MSSSQETKRPTDKASSAASGVPHIRHRVYEVYQQRGGERPHAIEDWLQAEAASVPKKPIISEKSNRKTA